MFQIIPGSYTFILRLNNKHLKISNFNDYLQLTLNDFNLVKSLIFRRSMFIFFNRDFISKLKLARFLIFIIIDVACVP